MRTITSILEGMRLAVVVAAISLALLACTDNTSPTALTEPLVVPSSRSRSALK
jgi:hypothetical protein